LTIVSKYAIIEVTNINKHMNKYKQWYANITERAKNRVLETYTESHHIVPRSLGGGDEADNLVNLTAREHFVCHWLLVKMTTGQDHHKMLNALRMMRAKKSGQLRYTTKITARVYENIKQEYAELQSKQFTGAGNGMFGKHHTQETKDKMWGKTHSEETLAKMSAKATGRKQSEETIRKKIEATKGKKREKLLCPHCDQLVAVNGYARWHGINCQHQ
jgi:hypothetical protein